MANWVGSSTQGAAFPSSAVWPSVGIPAAAAGQTQVLAISYKDKASPVGTIAGWTAIRNAGHTTAPGALAVFARKLTSDVSASTISIGFSGAVQGCYVCRTVSGDYAGITATSQQDGTASVTLPPITVSKTGTAILEIWASGEWPRVFPTSGSGVETVHQTSTSGPGLTFATRVVNAGTVSGTTFIPDDPGAGGIDTSFDGTNDWSPALGFALLFEDSGASPPSPSPTYSGSTDQSFSGSSISLSYASAAAGTTQYIAVNYQPASSYQVNTPFGWTLLDASRVDEFAGRLAVFSRRLDASAPAGSVTLTFTGPCSGAAGIVSVIGSTQGVARNDSAQSAFVRNIFIPPVNSAVANAMTLVFAGSANFARVITMGGDATKVVDRAGPPSLAVGYAPQGAGASSVTQWTPVDPDSPTTDGGDAFRVIVVAIAPYSSGTPTQDVDVEIAGTLGYVPAPTGLVVSNVTATGATIVWVDHAVDETEYQYMYRRQQESWPATATALPANTTTVNLTGLTTGQPYEFIVLARRGDDFSAWSSVATFSTALTIVSARVTAPVTRADIGSAVTFTLQVSPPTSVRLTNWQSTGGAQFVSYQMVTDGSGRAEAVVRGDYQNIVRVSATIGQITATAAEVTFGAPAEGLVLTITPARIEAGDVAHARVTGSRGGLYWLGRSVSLVSSNGGVAASQQLGQMQPTASGGSENVFVIPGIANGTTSISAQIDGTSSNAVSLVVADPPGPPVYTSGVATHCAIHLEAPLAAAVRPRIRRMTHADQQFHHPGDEGFKFAAAYALKEPIFFTKERLRGG